MCSETVRIAAAAAAVATTTTTTTTTTTFEHMKINILVFEIL